MIYGHDDNLGHVTKTIFIDLCPLFLRTLYVNGFDWPCGFIEDV